MKTINSSEPVRRVGFVGLGRMGFPMAGHLANAGFDLTVLDLQAEVVGRFCDTHSAAATPTLADLAKVSDTVVTMLPTSREVRQVVLGDGAAPGLAAQLPADALLIDCSSGDPDVTREIGAELVSRAIHMIDAPVAGGVVFAEDGSLDVLVGGSPEAVSRAEPVLTSFSRKILNCGALGAGHAMKAINNFVNAQALVTYVEAMTTGLRAGIDIAALTAALEQATTGRNHPFEKKIVKQVLTRRFATGMALSLIAKDVDLARDIGQRMGLEAPIGSLCSDLWHRAAEEVGGSADQTCVARLWEKMASVTLGQGSMENQGDG
jgi:3-hydroxyisobutyrate dehydrogenase